MIEVAAGEMFNKRLENYYRLTCLSRDKPGPIGFQRSPRWKVVPVLDDAAN